MKVVINRCWGGFGLSVAATLALYDGGWTELGTPVEKWYGPTSERKEKELAEWRAYVASGGASASPFLTAFSKDESHVVYFSRGDGVRSDPRLVEVVEKMGKAAWGNHAELRIVEIPDGVQFEIDDYDGMEAVSEIHRSWS